MSRIGRSPVTIPSGVLVTIEGTQVRVKGPKGELVRSFRPEMTVKQADGVLTVERPNDQPHVRALHGLTRALLNNMVLGVSEGFEKALQVEGVGYRPEKSGADLVLNVGFSHPVRVLPPAGVTFEIDERARTIKVKRLRQGTDRPGGGRHPQGPAAGAVQGQGHSIRRRVRAS